MLSFRYNTHLSFFDRKAVIRAVDEAKRGVMARSGAYVARVARRSMKYRKGPSPPGQPPHAHREGRGALLRKLMRFAYDTGTESTVVGPEIGRRPTGAPHRQEYGGRFRVARNPRRRIRKLGDAGEIRLGGTRSRSTKPAGGELVTYAVLETEAQVRRANEINEALYGPLSYTAQYPERPFMRPALEASKDVLVEMWEGQIRA